MTLPASQARNHLAYFTSPEIAPAESVWVCGACDLHARVCWRCPGDAFVVTL